MRRNALKEIAKALRISQRQWLQGNSENPLLDQEGRILSLEFGLLPAASRHLLFKDYPGPVSIPRAT